MKVFVGYCVLVCLFAITEGGREVGFGTVRRDTFAGETVLEQGEVPSWLHGSFIRHACGSFGESGSNDTIINRVDCLFDCVPMGQSYRFEDGKVTFYNRYYDTATADLWKAYNMNMNDSRVFWRTAMSRIDSDRYQALTPIIKNSPKIDNFPFVTFWQMDNKVFAHSEFPGLVQIDPHQMIHKLQFHEFDDDNFGFTDEIIVNEDAHEVQDPDGTLYCTHMVYKLNPQTFTMQQWKNVFKIKDNKRSTVAKLPYPDLDLKLCHASPSKRYPIYEHRQGILHSIAMTENYLIIPESSYLVDMCSLILFFKPDAPALGQLFEWSADTDSTLWVVRKSDGAIMANIKTKAFFSTHQINAYEDNGLMHVDMVLFEEGTVYTEVAMVSNLMSNTEEVKMSYFHRFTISIDDWTLVSRQDLIPGPTSGELPNINPDYVAKSYTYTWALLGLFSASPHTLIKVNVRTNEIEHKYSFGDDMAGTEPIFHKRPNSQAEDDGIIMIQGIDLVKEKGFLMIFDARDLSLLSHVTGTDLTLFGIHSKFYQAHVGAMTEADFATDKADGVKTKEEL